MFEQIKKKCPKGWEKFKEYDDHSGLTPLIGHLFTFFDSVGIYTTVSYFGNDDGSKVSWVYHFTIENDYPIGGGRVFKLRTEAWEAAILKAFEIYEKILEEK